MRIKENELGEGYYSFFGKWVTQAGGTTACERQQMLSFLVQVGEHSNGENQSYHHLDLEQWACKLHGKSTE